MMMKKQEGEVRSLVFKLRLNRVEKSKLQELQKRSTEKDLSSYIRKVSLKEPVIIKCRDQSADDLLMCLLQLNKELNGLGNNFNQAVKKLHILDKIPEFRIWIQHHQSLQQTLITKTEEIRLFMHQFSQLWLQK